MTEQDVQNTLHSLDVIKQFLASGKSFYEFFEENKDKVMATYTDSIDTPYYSRHIDRHWLSEKIYIERRLGSDTFGDRTAKTENIVLVNVYDPSKGSILDNTIDGMSWEERLNLPIETKTIGKYLLEDLKPSESLFILSAYSDLFGEEHIKKAYLKSCVEEAENELAELRSYEDISPYGGEDVSISNFESYLLENLDNAQEMGFASVGEAALKCVELGLIDEKRRKNVINEIYDSAESIKQDYEKGWLSKDDVKYLAKRHDPVVDEPKRIADSLFEIKEMSKKREKLSAAVKLYSAKSEYYKNRGNLKELKTIDDRIVACIEGNDCYSKHIEETYNSVLPYLSHTNGIQYLKTEDIPISIHMNGIKADFDEPRITTDANHKVIWDCVFYKVEEPSADVSSLYESHYFKAEACDELYRLIGEEPPKRYEGIQAVQLPPEIAKKVDLTLKFIDTEDYESSVRVVSKIDKIKGRIAEADMENLKDIKPNLWNKIFRHSEVKKREISSANLRNNKIELEQVYDELNKITQKMMCENFEDDSENRTTKESIEIDYPEEKSLDENMDFNQLSSFLDNEEEEQDEVLDLTSKSGRSL